MAIVGLDSFSRRSRSNSDGSVAGTTIVATPASTARAIVSSTSPANCSAATCACVSISSGAEVIDHSVDVAARLHTYYNAERFLVEDENLKRSRLALVAATRQVLANGLALLGVSAPERM